MAAPAFVEQRVPLDLVRSSLTRIWFSGAGISFAVIFIQSIIGHYGEHVKDVWSWYVPLVVPTLSLIITVLGAAAMEGFGARTVKAFFYSLAWWLSLAYLLALNATLLLAPFSPYEFEKLYQLSNYGLGPLQGLCVAAIGYVFVSKHEEEKPEMGQTMP